MSEPPAIADTIREQKQVAEERRDTLKEELERYEKLIDWLDQGLNLAGELPAAQPRAIEAPPLKVSGRPAAASKRKRATGSTSTPRGKASAVVADRRRRIVVFVGTRGACSQAEIVDGTGIEKHFVTADAKHLVNRGELVGTGTRRSRRYSVPGGPNVTSRAAKPKVAADPQQSPSGPPDDLTDVERLVYDACEEHALTASGIAVKAKVPADVAGAVAHRLFQRGVFKRLDEKDPPMRYAPAG